MRALGVRAGPLRAEGKVDGFVAAYEYADALFRAGLFSARYADRIWFGYDGRDITYDFAMNASLGVLVPLGQHHGPVFRGALRGEALQLAGLNWTQLAIPAFEAGYSYLNGPNQFELVGLLAPSWAGELRQDGERWDLSGLHWGTLMTIRWQMVSFTLDAAFTEIADQGRTMRGVAHVCGLLGGYPSPRAGGSWVTQAEEEARKFRALLCADFSTVQLLQPNSDSSPSVSSVGLSLLVGNVSHLYRPRRNDL